MKELLCKITVLLCVVASAQFIAGCSQTDDTNEGQMTLVPITIEVDVEPISSTRGYIMTTQDFTEYGLFGVYGKQIFANNIVYTKNEDGGWESNKPLYWPAGEANFYTVNAPFAKKATGPFDKVTVNSTKQTFTYTVPDDAKDQFDLMISSSFNKSEANTEGKLRLTFSHIMAFLNFTIVNNMEEGNIVNVGGISVYNVIKDGVFNFSTTVEHSGTWTEGTTRGKMDRVFYEPFEMPRTVNYLQSSDSLFMLVPQGKTTKWKTKVDAPVTLAEADAEGHTYLKLLCKIQDEGGNYIFGSADAYGDVYLPFNIAKTTMTKTTTYRISFAGGYDENGMPLSFGSDFSIEVEDWDETPGADPIEVEF